MTDKECFVGEREIRVLHLITRLDRGGSATSTLLTVAGLSAPFRSMLMYGRTREFPQLALDLQGKVEMVEVPELVRRPSPVRDLLALLRIYRLIRRGTFDLVHTHTSKAGFLGRVAARLAGVPRIVHTPHGHVFTGYAGRPLTRLFILLERWAATFTDRIIGLTEQESRDHLAQKIGEPRQYVSIPSGVEIGRFRPSSEAAAEGREPDRASERSRTRAALGLRPEAFVVGSVGRLEPVKGHVYLLEAFTALTPRFPALHLALVGDGELSPTLRASAERHKVSDRVLFLGWRADTPALLQAFDLFVFPSLNEGMGRALVEAMAAGLPIVASRAGGIPEVLEDGKSGLLVERGNSLALAREIEELLLDPERRVRLAKAARERAGHYSVETMLQQIEALYREVLERRE